MIGFIGSVIRFFSSIWKLIIAGIAIAAVSYALGFYMGYQNHKALDLAREKEVVTVYVQAKQDKQEVADKIAVKREEQRTKIEVRYVEVEKKITQAAPVVNLSCPDLGADWVRLYNETTTGVLPTP